MEVKILKGGPGSGHHGHSGRPGKRGGSTPNTLPEAIINFEKEYSNPENIQDRERLMIVNVEGKVVVDKQSDEQFSVRLPFGNYKEAIVTHNHPPHISQRKFGGIVEKFGRNGYSQPFSPSDVSIAEQYNFKELRAVGFIERVPVTYIMRRTGDSWPPLASYYSSNITKHVNSAFQNADPSVSPAKLSVDALNNLWNSAADDLGGIEYEVIDG